MDLHHDPHLKVSTQRGARTGLAGALDLERVRSHLLAQPPALDHPLLRPAAVLLPLFELDGELHLLFTLRTQQVRKHKGQVCFPGGGYQPGDTSLLDTALRECREELGLEPDWVQVLGYLDPLPTISDYCVLPVVGAIPWPLTLRPCPDEIAEVFSIPLPRLLEPSLCYLDERKHAGVRYYPIFHFTGGTHRVWGVTGYLIANLLQRVFGWSPPQLDTARLHLPGLSLDHLRSK